MVRGPVLLRLDLGHLLGQSPGLRRAHHRAHGDLAPLHRGVDDPVLIERLELVVLPAAAVHGVRRAEALHPADPRCAVDHQFPNLIHRLLPSPSVPAPDRRDRDRKFLIPYDSVYTSFSENVSPKSKIPPIWWKKPKVSPSLTLKTAKKRTSHPGGPPVRGGLSASPFRRRCSRCRGCAGRQSTRWRRRR